MRILLLGANGQVGTECRRSLATVGDVVAATRNGRLDSGAECERADFDNPDSLAQLLGRVAPDVVVNAAAYTAVDRAETDREAAWRVNAEAPARLAAACSARDALLVHYSTDYVFDGTASRPYRESDPTNPLGIYGESKLAGEDAIRGGGCRHMIFRTAWVYGLHGHNFLRTMLRLGAERDELRVVADQVGTPTPAALIADCTAQALRTGSPASGTWHLTATGATSWHGFAEEIMRYAVQAGLLPKAPSVVPITTAEYPTPARRPAYSCLDTSRLAGDFAVTLPEWREALAGVLASRAL
jgi:dTDP-4-dehydrorhamnose reductase